MRHMIVGIDTGKVSAMACLDLQGRIIMLAHTTEGGHAWFIKTIRSCGVPSLIATDRRNAGLMLKRLGAAFNAVAFSPPSDISVKEKHRLARQAGIKDQHERDAYAAAKTAFNAYANKLGQAASIAARRNAADVEAIKAKVIMRHSINEALLGRSANRMRSPRKI